MPYRKCIVTAVLTLSTAIAAASAAEPSSLEKFPFDESMHEGTPLLFIAVPADLSSGLHTMSVLVRQGTRELFREMVSFRLEHEHGDDAVELLATAPVGKLSNLLERSRRPFGEVRVAVSFDGAPATESSLEEILSGSAPLLAGGHQPVGLTVLPRLFDDGAVSRVTASACSDDCADQFDWCVANRCDYSSTSCDACYDEFDECVFQCQCPTVESGPNRPPFRSAPPAIRAALNTTCRRQETR